MLVKETIWMHLPLCNQHNAVSVSTMFNSICHLVLPLLSFFFFFLPCRGFSALSSSIQHRLVLPALHSVRPGTLLGDLPTPCLLLELSLAERAHNGTARALAQALSSGNCRTAMQSALFWHARCIDTDERDARAQQVGSGKSQVICRLDAVSDCANCYLSIGLANHLVGGYYWARGMGMGANLPAHGVYHNSTGLQESRIFGILFTFLG